MPEVPQSPAVADDSIVVPVSLQFSLQRLSNLSDLPGADFSKPLLDSLQRLPQLLGVCFPPHRRGSLSGSSPTEIESQKRERTAPLLVPASAITSSRLLLARLAASAGIVTEVPKGRLSGESLGYYLFVPYTGCRAW